MIKKYEAFNLFIRPKKAIKEDPKVIDIDILNLKSDISEGLIDIRDNGFSIKVDIGGKFVNLNVLISISKCSSKSPHVTKLFAIDEVKDNIITTLDILKDRYNIIDLEITYKTKMDFSVDTNYDGFIEEDGAYEISKIYLRFGISNTGQFNHERYFI